MIFKHAPCQAVDNDQIEVEKDGLRMSIDLDAATLWLWLIIVVSLQGFTKKPLSLESLFIARI
jgi:hypothetical protein